jgi:hypothetical protein
MKWTCVGVMMAVLVSPLSWLQAQEQAAPQAKPEAAPSTPDLMAGPALQERPKLKTLVQFDYEGKLRRPGGEGMMKAVTVEEAALALLSLSKDELEKIEAIKTKRAAAFDALVIRELDTLLELQAAAAAGKQAEVGKLLLKLSRSSDEIRKPGTIRSQFERSLTREHRREFGRLLDEYVEALRNESADQSTPMMDEMAEFEADAGILGEADAGTGEEMEPAKGERKRRFQVVIEERLRGLQIELERSVDRVIRNREGEQEFEALLASLELNQDQERRVRSLVQQFVLETKFSPNESDYARLVVKIMAFLDEGQRDKLTRWIAEQTAERRGEPALKTRKKPANKPSNNR